MKYLRSFRLYENNDDELKYLFNMVMTDIMVYTLPYGRFSTIDFNVYVVKGNRIGGDDKEILKDIYHNHEILNNIHNMEFYHIGLTEKEVFITIKDFKDEWHNENYLKYLPERFLSDKLPNDVFLKMKPYLGNFSSQSSKWLSSGIDYSDGSSSNLSLFDWIYEK